MHRLILDDVFEDDVDVVVDWYLDQSTPDSAERFLKELQRSITFIRKMPGAAPFAEPGVRCKPLATFPHSIYYEFEDEYVYVFGVFDQRRNPDLWKERVRKSR